MKRFALAFLAGILTACSAPAATPIQQQDLPYGALAQTFFARGIEPMGQALNARGEPAGMTNWDMAASTIRHYAFRQQTVNPECVLNKNVEAMRNYPGAISIIKMKPGGNGATAEGAYTFNITQGSELPNSSILEQVINNCLSDRFF